jgi:hypothetical protein
LAEAFPLVVDVVLGQVAPARFQRDDADALLGQFVGQHAAARAGADDDDTLSSFRSNGAAMVCLLPLA